MELGLEGSLLLPDGSTVSMGEGLGGSLPARVPGRAMGEGPGATLPMCPGPVAKPRGQPV